MGVESTIGWMPAGPPPPSSPQPRRPMRMMWFDKKLKIFWDGFMVVEGVTEDTYSLMTKWLEDNLTKKKFKTTVTKRQGLAWTLTGSRGIGIKTRKEMPTIYFRSKEDAMAFKLRWM